MNPAMFFRLVLITARAVFLNLELCGRTVKTTLPGKDKTQRKSALPGRHANVAGE